MKKALLVLFAVAALFAGCKKQEEAIAPEATLPEVTEQAPAVSVDTTTAPAPVMPEATK